MQTLPPQKLIFIYNADSGFKNLVMDIAHKILSPKTYPCSLCDITHGVFKEHEDWKKFREESNLDMDFLHKDEFEQQYASKFGHKYHYPVILAQSHNDLEVFISKDELDAMQTATDLMQIINQRASVTHTRP
ncbi:MAG: GTPase [Cytophagaceae bacterium]|nr:GTPase [Cytophagaceae bacterium]|tara:strand:+ start:175 stop:570 length:396 start_codon:yes stop_codon:yes gene_type:complete